MALLCICWVIYNPKVAIMELFAKIPNPARQVRAVVFFVIMAMQKDLCYPNHPLYKWVHSEKATSPFWMVQIHMSVKSPFFQR